MLLQVALNGSRSPNEHPALPVTPEQIAAEAQRAVAAGAHEIHLHVRAADGRESLTPRDVAHTLTLVRAACPGVPVGVSTAAGIVGDAEERHRLVGRWTVLPDYASVNVHEDGALELIKLLLGMGVGVEAGVWNAAAAERLNDSGLAAHCMRILIEAHDADLAAARANAAAIIATLDLAAIERPRLLHGLDGTAWDLVGDALARGCDTRVGLEDMLTLPDGAQAEDNAAIVGAAMEMIAGRIM